MQRYLESIAEKVLGEWGGFLGAGAAGATVFLVVFAVLHIVMRFRSRDITRLGGMARKSPVLVFFTPVLNRLAFIANYTSTAKHRRWVANVLHKADLMGEMSADLVETLKVFCALMTVVGVTLLMLAMGMTPSVPFLILLAVAAFYFPDIMLYMKAEERMARMSRALPFFLDLMTVSAETGLAFQQSIRNVINNCSRGWREDNAEENAGERDLAEEFERIAGDMRIGRSMADSLSASMERVDLDEYKSFGSAILQADRLGAPIVDALRTQARELRVKLAARAEAKAAKAPVKILFPLIIFIFPVTAWVIVGPVLLTIYYGNY